MEVSTLVLCPPHDMITYILRRCCMLQTLDICKTVSKEWNQIIYDPSFMSQYYGHREDNVYGYLIQNVCRCQHFHKFISVNQSDNKFAFSPKTSNIFDDVQIKSSSLQGILCCWIRSCGRSQFYVCKPTTGQWKQLPNPSEFLYSDYKQVVGMAVLGSNPLRYVILHISTYMYSRQGQDGNYKCEIFDSMTWGWKKLDDLLLPDGCFIVGKAGVFASGVISWITSNKTIIAFSTDGESRYVYGLPAAESKLHYKDKESFYYHDIIEYQGKLGLICQTYNNKYVELWILKNYTSGGWTKIKSIDFESVVVNEERHARPVQFYNSEVILVKGVYEVMFCNLAEEDGGTGTGTGTGNATGTYNKVNTGYPTDPETFPFRSDFIPVNLKEFRAEDIN